MWLGSLESLRIVVNVCCLSDVASETFATGSSDYILRPTPKQLRLQPAAGSTTHDVWPLSVAFAGSFLGLLVYSVAKELT